MATRFNLKLFITSPKRIISVLAATVILLLVSETLTLPSRVALLPSLKLKTEEVTDDSEVEDGTHLGEGQDVDTEFAVDLRDGDPMKKAEGSAGELIRLRNSRYDVVEQQDDAALVSHGANKLNHTLPVRQTISHGEPLEEVSTVSKTSSRTLVKNKRRRMPPISMSEMNQILERNHASYDAMRPRRFSPRDEELLAAKALIENAPPSPKSDPQLHAPVFRNISKFERSYKLMEEMLKVYVYEEGEKPIFHQPFLEGIYASEGWFMKLMETNTHYLVKDPRNAHLFYMPFSSRLLQLTLYARGPRHRINLEQYLANYVDTIAAKYPFWNRTGGSDHFIVACHDWAPFETRNALEPCIRALCVADLPKKFRLGKDVSLPETYVLSAGNPLRDLGGEPANNRSILAFYAGKMHGPLRTTLLQHWENKEPDMKIYGPMPKGVSWQMAYIQHMKSSKYCICPRGYEVNSPRVVESIFY